MRGLAKILAATVLIVCAALTFRQTFIYRDLPTLLSDIIEKNPRNWMPYANLAEHLDAQGRYEEAVQLLTTCIAPARKRGCGGMASSRYIESSDLCSWRRRDTTKRKLSLALRLALRPFDCRALYGQGMALASQRRWAEAQARFEKALGIDPNYAEGHYGLGLALANQGRADEAIWHFQKSIELNPADPLAHFELANLLAVRGELRSGVALLGDREAQARPRRRAEQSRRDLEGSGRIGRSNSVPEQGAATRSKQCGHESGTGTGACDGAC